MAWSQDPPPNTVLERGRPRSAPLLPTGMEPPHILAGRAWIAVRALYRAQARLARMEGDHLELLLRQRWYGRCGFASFRDFVREELQLAPRTARRRVALSRLVSESRELSAALDEGRLSPCQVLVLFRLCDAPDLVSWIRMAEDCTVRELENLVSNFLSNLACDANANVVADVEPELESDEPGRRVTFAAPVSAAVAWEHSMDMARRVLGWEAPIYRCIEAVLAETAVDLVCSDHEKKEEPRAVEAPFPSSAPLNDNLPGSIEARSPSVKPGLLRVTHEQIETLLCTIQDAEEELNAIASMVVPREEDPDRSIDALVDLQRKDRSLRLVMARLLRGMDAANVIAFLGHGRRPACDRANVGLRGSKQSRLFHSRGRGKLANVGHSGGLRFPNREDNHLLLGT